MVVKQQEVLILAVAEVDNLELVLEVRKQVAQES
jgi:hypothetical protein